MRYVCASIVVCLCVVVGSLCGQETTGSSVAESLPPPLPLDASGKPVEVPKSNLDRSDFARVLVVDSVGPALKSAASIRKLVECARENGFDTILAQVRFMGDAYYNSQIVPKAADISADFDPLKTLIEEARSGVPKIKVYALLCGLRVGTRDQQLPPKHVVLEHRDWLTRTLDGQETFGEDKDSAKNTEYWLDPGVVEVQDHIALVAAEIARSYAVDGISLERVRMPDVSLRGGYNPKALERFRAEKNRTDTPDPKDPAWIEWRRGQVTELMRKTREAVKAARPGVDFSAAAITYGAPPARREAFVTGSTPGAFALCDWQGWAEQGIVDSLALMNYKAAETRAGDYEGWMNFALANKGKARVWVIEGGWLNTSKLSAAMMLLPIFDPRADGVGLYSYHQPAASPESPETAYSVIKAVLRKENVEKRAPQLVRYLTKPLTTSHKDSLARLNEIASVMSGGVAGTKATAQQGTETSLPPLTGAIGGTKAADLPPLAASQSVAPQMPVLSEPSQATQPVAGAAQKQLPPLSSAPVGSAQAPPAPTTGDKQLPPLGAAASAGTAASQASQGMPNLPSTESQPASAVAGQPSLPALGAAATPGASTAIQASQGMPTLPGTELQPVPAMAAQSTPQPAASASAAPPALPALQPGTTSSVPPASSAVPASGMAGPSSSAAAPPALPQLTEKTPPQAGEQELPVVAPPPSVPAVEATPAPEPAATPGLVEKFSRMGVPTEETRGSITIPGTTGETNFSPAAITTPASSAPLFVAPSVLSPTPAAPTPKPINVMSLMPTPRVIDYSNTQDSPFIRTTPVAGPRNFAPQGETISTPAPAAALTSGELIVLKNGSQFVGQVQERGSVWRIQLPNGSKIAIPANKIAGTRPVAPAPGQ